MGSDKCMSLWLAVFFLREATDMFGADEWANFAMVKEMVAELETTVKTVPTLKTEFDATMATMKGELADISTGAALREFQDRVEKARTATGQAMAVVRAKAKAIKSAMAKKDKDKLANLVCMQVDESEEFASEKGFIVQAASQVCTDKGDAINAPLWESLGDEKNETPRILHRLEMPQAVENFKGKATLMGLSRWLLSQLSNKK